MAEVFNLGNSLMRGAQMGAMLRDAQMAQQNALMPDMTGSVGGVMVGGMPKDEYKARRTVIEDQRKDLEYQQSQEDRQYEVSQRPVAEAQAQADVKKTVVEIAKLDAETGKIAAEAAAIGGQEARKQTQAENNAQAVEYRAWAQAGAQALRSGQWAAYVGGFSEALAAIDGEGGITPEMVMDENNAEMVLAFVSSYAAGMQDPEGASVFDDSEFIDRMSGGGAVDPMSPQGKFYADQRAGLIPEDEQYKGGGPTINMPGSGPGLGKLSTDYAYVIDPQTNEPKIDLATGLPIAAPVPGSPAAQAIQGGVQAADAKIAQEKQQAGIVLQNVTDLKETLTKESQGGRSLFDLPETGRFGNTLSQLGLNQEAIDVGQKLATLQSAIAFDRLQKMRDASPTGGALGAVSAPELLLLQNSVGALSQITSKDELLKTLDVIEGIMKKFEAYPETPVGPPVIQNRADIESSARAVAEPAMNLPYLENGLPDFSAMTDEQLDEYIIRGGGQ